MSIFKANTDQVKPFQGFFNAFSQPLNQSVNQWFNQPLNQLSNQSLNQPMNQPMNQPSNQPLNQGINESLKSFNTFSKNPMPITNPQVINNQSPEVLHNNHNPSINTNNPATQESAYLINNTFKDSTQAQSMQNQLLASLTPKEIFENEVNEIYGLSPLII